MPIPSALRSRPRRGLLALLGAATLVTGVLAAAPAAGAAPTARPGQPDLGPNTVVLSPDMPQAEVQAKLDAIAADRVPDQFGPGRVAVLFLPGTYGSAADPLNFQLGYGEEVAGLGKSPSDVVINGTANVYNQCAGDPGGNVSDGCVALNNFWRSLSNLTINPMGGEGCHANTEFWAVSQAAPMRRVQVNGPTTLMDYCTNPSYASGGFIADSALGAVTNGSQQQWLTRNSSVASWSNGVWNQVFSGVQGAPAETFPADGHAVADGPNPYTVVDRTPVSREKPFLYVDDRGAWKVFVPAARTSTTGTSWSTGSEAGRSLPLSRFRIVQPGDSAASIQRSLRRGQDLLVTPGVYGIDRSLTVTRPNTVVLGLGFATLTAERGAVPIRVAGVPGVDLAGLIVDAGATNSPALVEVGARRGAGGSARNPIALQDVFFRIGGPHAGRATTSLVVNSDHVVLDDIWAWRADHGTGVGWTQNTARNGVVVNGDDVTATGLFVEHYQQYNAIWNGERGRTIFFQNELPYDAPSQAAWRHGSVNGYAAYTVADSVRWNRVDGAGSYIYTNVVPTLHASRAFEVPRRPGVQLRHLVTVSLNDAGTIDHVVNGTGEAAVPKTGGSDVVFLNRYP
ncbi:adenylyl cyclase [Amnibacterium kyonggiense]|uniref:Adenylyl cyclase n=1 Tax=Amnibacterium kyonggiense TaxID=595671 RepID=A0A4R7FQC4_9MICO|nr:adenylyl cyclase [Amnibacterium kyonggiense]TDS79799.1 hypothetical protein CLV52_0341 [Amnibacterium kyonggiense]